MYTSDSPPSVAPEIFRLETELLRQRENTIEMDFLDWQETSAQTVSLE
jgi:hypothetical protein